ncbi:MAG TPA: hypothetical protein VMS98_01740 [Thermoanaerobaculia bacterium]|nr:hypothetical protein [Thermoanaerobaculia bacterium]
MKKVIVFLTLATVALAGCGGGGTDLQRDQTQYEVVQEGSTAAGPADLGPTAMPAAMTGTNADTTSAFTLSDTAALSTTAPPGTIAETFPVTPVYRGDAPRTPRRDPPPVTPTPPPTPRAEPEQPAPVPAPEPESEREQQQEQPEEEPEEQREDEPSTDPQPPPPPTDP